MSIHEFSIKEEELIQFKKRRYVRQMTESAIRRGELSRSTTCDLCDAKDCEIDAHHVDYGKPLEIIWVCSICHGKVHRKNHKLNPENNKQTPLPEVCKKYEEVTVTFTIPIRNYLALKEQAETRNISMSKLVRELTINKCPARSKQLEFDFKEGIHDKPSNVIQPGIQSLAKNEIVLQQPERTQLSEIWRQGDFSLLRMEAEFLPIFGGYGENAAKLQRISSN